MFSAQPILVTKLRDLDVIRSRDDQTRGEPPFLSSASGLVGFGDSWYVVADTELQLATFNKSKPGELIDLIPGHLPVNPRARKKQKPDFEALVLIEGSGELLVLPSGSKPNRQTACVYSLTNRDIFTFSVAPLYESLGNKFGELNIEGAASVGDEFILAQRGNAAHSVNALVRLEKQSALEELHSKKELTAKSLLDCVVLDLGMIEQVKLSITDLCPNPKGGLFFLAAAEQTDSAYEDGEFVGAVIGRLSLQGEVLSCARLECPHKPEGLSLDPDVSATSFVVVTDADDPLIPSSLYRGDLASLLTR